VSDKIEKGNEMRYRVKNIDDNRTIMSMQKYKRLSPLADIFWSWWLEQKHWWQAPMGDEQWT